MANKEIHGLPIKTDISDTSVIPFDDDLGGGIYQASSIKWANVLGNAIRGFAKLASANIFTNINTFLKQLKIISDGSASPLVVRDSTDTSTMFEIDANTGQLMVMGAGASNGEVIIKSPSGSSNPAVRFRSNGSGVNAFSFYSNNGCGVFQSQFSGYWFQVSDLTFGHVSINENNSSVPTQAIFYVNGIIGTTYKGSMPVPQLTTTQRNLISGTKPIGLLVDNSTTNQLERWNGTAWDGFATQTALNNKVDKPTTATLTTTNNTATQIYQFSSLANGVYMFDIEVDGFETATNSAYTGRFKINIKVAAGFASLVNAITSGQIVGSNFPGGVQTTVTVATNNVNVFVTGRTGSTINWNFRRINK